MRKRVKILHQNGMKCKCKHPLYKQLLKSNRMCDYYTGVQNTEAIWKRSMILFLLSYKGDER